ncbi:MAG: polysaccharide biosynthesis/export family protein [Alphaproteobacteria bacterium]|nr:polysaccharide biosynthesis/export family protein [Alphaproteobacteria bacterium]MCW5738728.1 polysaccharide biosynthesis/export family protein [Alphaproteobacteria bacterium]
MPSTRAGSRTSRIVALALAALLAACGDDTIPASGPDMNAVVPGNPLNLPFDIYDLTPQTIDAIVRAPTAPAVSAARPQRGAVPAIIVAPGDVLRVRIFEPYDGSIYAPLQKGGSEVGLLRVAENGTISVPYAGNVPVAGVGLQTVEQRIVAKLTGRAYQPQVVVELAVDRSNTYAVSGDVKQPGRYSLLEGAKTLVDAINRAGGTTRAPNQHEVVLKRRGVEYRIPMSDLLAGGDIMLQRDDTLVVSTNIKAFTALGAVLKSGNIEINRTKVSLLEALGEVGGLSDERANKTGVFVFRPQDSSAFVRPLDRPVVYRLDFAKPASVFVAQQFPMHPRDVVYVSNSPLYEANKVLSVFGTLFNFGLRPATIP